MKKVIVIGAGVGGLSAATYAQYNGFQSIILEKNPTPGGFCTGWEREGHKIDGCIHWLTGTKKGTSFYEMWKECDAFDDDQIVVADNFGVFHYGDIKITLWNDLNRLEKELIEISPLDEKEIKKFTKNVLKVANVPLPTDTAINTMMVPAFLKSGIILTPSLFMMLKLMIREEDNYSLRFKHPALRYLMANVLPNNNGMYSTFYAFSTVAFGNGGVP